MAHFIVKFPDGSYLSTRKATNPRDPYCARATTSGLEGCRVFNTKTAANTSARHAGKPDCQVIEVEMKVKLL